MTCGRAGGRRAGSRASCCVHVIRVATRPSHEIRRTTHPSAAASLQLRVGGPPLHVHGPKLRCMPPTGVRKASLEAVQKYCSNVTIRMYLPRNQGSRATGGNTPPACLWRAHTSIAICTESACGATGLAGYARPHPPLAAHIQPPSHTCGSVRVRRSTSACGWSRNTARHRSLAPEPTTPAGRAGPGRRRHNNNDMF